jgi:hypothetical protein
VEGDRHDESPRKFAPSAPLLHGAKDEERQRDV